MLVVTVSVEVEVVETGSKLAPAPAGKPLTLKATELLKPLLGVILTV